MTQIKTINHRQVSSLSEPIYQILLEKFNKKCKEQQEKLDDKIKEVIEYNKDIKFLKKERENALNKIHKTAELLLPMKKIVTEKEWKDFLNGYYSHSNYIILNATNYLNIKQLFDEKYEEDTKEQIEKLANSISIKLLGISNCIQKELDLKNEITARLSVTATEPYDIIVNKIVSDIDINKFFKPE